LCLLLCLCLCSFFSFLAFLWRRSWPARHVNSISSSSCRPLASTIQASAAGLLTAVTIRTAAAWGSAAAPAALLVIF
jgi:hypothetical protein